MTDQQFAAICHNVLEVVDNSDNGIALVRVEEVLMKAVSFAAFVRAINILRRNGLITVDGNSIAYRVRT